MLRRDCRIPVNQYLTEATSQQAFIVTATQTMAFITVCSDERPPSYVWIHLETAII